jgi:hypothetical protein
LYLQDVPAIAGQAKPKLLYPLAGNDLGASNADVSGSIGFGRSAPTKVTSGLNEAAEASLPRHHSVPI